MLTALELRDFKSFAALPDGSAQRVSVAPFTLLVGANASGKSNFLDALQFLQGLALDLSVAEVLGGRYDGQRETWPGLRGGAAEVAYRGRSRFVISTTWAIESRALRYDLECTLDREARPLMGTERAAFVDGDVVFEATVDGSGVHDRSLSTANLTEGASPTKSVVPLAFALNAVRKNANNEILMALQARLLRTALFDIRAARMRQYVPTSAQVLGVHGENASAVLWRLCQDAGHKQEVVDWLAELCAEEIADVRFDKTRLKEVMLLLVEQDGSEISARSASDGTLRFLGLLLALLTAEPGATLLLEEVENGLHPAGVHLLVELLERVTRENGVQVIATTHSPVVLGALSRPTLGNVIAFGRHPGLPGTLMKRLADLPRFDEVVERRGIEYLFTSQWLERAL